MSAPADVLLLIPLSDQGRLQICDPRLQVVPLRVCSVELSVVVPSHILQVTDRLGYLKCRALIRLDLSQLHLARGLGGLRLCPLFGVGLDAVELLRVLDGHPMLALSALGLSLRNLRCVCGLEGDDQLMIDEDDLVEPRDAPRHLVAVDAMLDEARARVHELAVGTWVERAVE